MAKLNRDARSIFWIAKFWPRMSIPIRIVGQYPIGGQGKSPVSMMQFYPVLMGPITI